MNTVTAAQVINTLIYAFNNTMNTVIAVQVINTLILCVQQHDEHCDCCPGNKHTHIKYVSNNTMNTVIAAQVINTLT